MKTRVAITVAVSSLVFALGAHSQPANQTVVSSSDAATPSVAPAAVPAPAVTPNQLVYAARLPSVTELTNAAAAQGLSIDKIEQTSTQITAVYRYGNGQTNTVAYLLLPAAGAPASPAASPVPTPSAPPAVVYQPAPAVVYQPAPSAGYYDDYGYGPAYYPYHLYPPVSFRVGLGFNFHDGYRGGYGGGYGGGFRGGHRGFRR